MSAPTASKAKPDADETDAEPQAETAGEPHVDVSSALEDKLVAWARWGLPVAVIAACVITGVVIGPSTGVLVLAAGALVGCISAFWQSVRTLAGETPLTGADAYSLGAPRAEEEQKRAVLRALKDLEFERSVGKISDEDYQALVARYRAEAKHLLRALDAEAQPQRRQVEAMLAKRLRREGLVAAGVTGTEPRTSDAGATAPGAVDRAKGKKAKTRAPATLAVRMEPGPKPGPEPESVAAERACVRCETLNDADAVYCKKCGARLANVVGANGGAGDDAPAEEVAS